MASYHCTVKVGAKGKAAPHAAYISREGKYSGKTRYEDLEVTATGNMPLWAKNNTAHFWNAADEYERANGATYREIEVALPREMTPDQRRALVEDFIVQEVGNRHAYQWAIHTPKAALENGEQPHAHIMYSERTVDSIERDPEQYFKRYNAKTPEKGGCRKDSAGTEDRLQATRQRWADVQNVHLERHGIDARVDHRSLKKQGIDRQPEKHIGPSRVMEMSVLDVAALRVRRIAEWSLESAQKEVSSQIDLSGDLKAAKAYLKNKHEAENERIRSTIFERIATAGRAASADIGNANSNVKTAREHVRASREHLNTATGLANGADRNSYGAAKAAREQRDARHFEGVAQALGAAIGRTFPEVARATARLEAIFKAQRIAEYQASVAAAHQVELQRAASIIAQVRIDVAAKHAASIQKKASIDRHSLSHAKVVDADELTPEQRMIAMARLRQTRENTEVAANVLGAESKSKMAPMPLASEDVALFQGAEIAIAAGDMKALASLLKKIDQAESKLTNGATPSGWDARPFDERSAAQQLANEDATRRREAINAEANAAGLTQVPFAVGQSTLISSTLDQSQKAAAEALARHVKTERPLGLFSRETKGTKEWDAQRAALETNKAGCDKAIAWRDGREATASTADGATFHKRLDEVRKEHAIKFDAVIVKCAPVKEALQDFTRERKRIERAIGALSEDTQKALGLERGRGLGRGR